MTAEISRTYFRGFLDVPAEHGFSMRFNGGQWIEKCRDGTEMYVARTGWDDVLTSDAPIDAPPAAEPKIPDTWAKSMYKKRARAREILRPAILKAALHAHCGCPQCVHVMRVSDDALSIEAWAQESWVETVSMQEANNLVAGRTVYHFFSGTHTSVADTSRGWILMQAWQGDVEIRRSTLRPGGALTRWEDEDVLMRWKGIQENAQTTFPPPADYHYDQ